MTRKGVLELRWVIEGLMDRAASIKASHHRYMQDTKVA